MGLRHRGLDVTEPTLFVLDGSQALPSAINAVFDHPVIARCEGHKEGARAHPPRRRRVAARGAGGDASRSDASECRRPWRTLCSTNAIESMIDLCRDHSRNVKRWRNGQMALRWCAAGMLETKKQFRRVNGHLHVKALCSALEAHVARASPDHHAATEEVAA